MSDDWWLRLVARLCGLCCWIVTGRSSLKKTILTFLLKKLQCSRWNNTDVSWQPLLSVWQTLSFCYCSHSDLLYEFTRVWYKNQHVYSNSQMQQRSKWLPFKHISLMCYLKSLMIIITELSVESTLCLNPQKLTFDLLWALSMANCSISYFWSWDDGSS